MGAQTRALRDLVRLAKRLRGYAAQSDDAHYIALFLVTAERLEARAAAPGFDITAHADALRHPGMDR